MFWPIVVFCSSLVLIAAFMLRAWLIAEKPAFEVMRCKVYVEKGLVVEPDAVEKEIRELQQDLNDAGLVGKIASSQHLMLMSIHLFKPLDGGPSVKSPHAAQMGKLFNGLTLSPYTVHVTWYQNRKSALKYELINAFLWEFEGSDMAHNEGSEERKLWDSFQ